jgi:hypothetical protein
MQGREARVNLRHVAEGAARQLKPTARKARPRQSLALKPRFETVRLEGAALEHTEIAIDTGDQSLLDGLPIRAQLGQHHGIDRHPFVLDPGGSGHIAAPQQRSRQV